MKILLVTNPAHDDKFKLLAEAHLADGAKSPEGLQESLRGEFPEATVRDGIIERGLQRWYAYREGHWIGANGAHGHSGR